jgi:hypothetical protein
MNARIEAIKTAQSAARARLNHIFDAVGDRWENQVYSEGANWNVRQIAIHLMVSDAGQNKSLKGIIAGGEGLPADFDLQLYNQRSVEKRAALTVDEARSGLANSFAERQVWLDTLDDAALNATGRDAALKMQTVEQFLLGMAEHERSHAKDIARALHISQSRSLRTEQNND